MTDFKTPQEQFWAGSFGDAYTDRNAGPHLVASNLALFGRVLTRTSGLKSLVEFGANRGLNLVALKQLLPASSFTAIEINGKAVEELEKLQWLTVEQASILEYVPSHSFDFVLVKTLLIHMNPEFLPTVYALLHRAASKYVCIVEYYNPSPVVVQYRDHEDRLFKRDFAGEMMAAYPDLRLVDYGFVYHGDPCFPQDDMTWFLLKKGSQ